VSNERKGELQMTGFQQLGIKEEILQGIKDLYFIEPTPIQKQTIPLALEGKDLIGQAQTGTGKTAAFVIPMLQKIDLKVNDTQGLIMTPTRELAIQIADDVQDLAKHMDVKVLALHGGKDIQAQMNKLNNKVHIIVGTPGRILDHLRRETLHFGRLKMLVLDEADKMLEMGFQEDVETVIATTGPKKQTLLFSATMPDRVKHLAHRFMFQPPHIRVEMKQITAEKTKQYYYVMNQSDKLDNLQSLLGELQPYLAIIFVNTQNRVEHVTEQLQLQGLEAKALHGGLSQNKREQLMDAFRQVKFQYLVCTDIAARGVDVEGVTHVINYDLPSDAESYIHRVGRTGRAGEEGTAITFVSPRQKSVMLKIEKAIKQKIEEKLLTQRAGFKETLQEKDSDKRDKKTFKKARTASAKAKMEPSNGKIASPEDKSTTARDKKKVKPGYKKKQAMAIKKDEQREKRKKINKHMTERMREMKRKESRSSRKR
jgi:ATP-dependent RNA helicase DeaD